MEPHEQHAQADRFLYTYKRCKKCTRQYLGLASCACGREKAALFSFSFIFKLDWSVANAWFVGLESKEWVEENQLSSIFFFLSFFFFSFHIPLVRVWVLENR